ncbi:PTS system glucose-specific EIICBA component [Lactobacillus helveticus]|nr:PTS system glucose-specific EIICBA component [Lactobacillus helveticus]NRO39088.1 PTS system glucose-specific EIICBA component [Lactobacillus helveticus]
MNNGPKTGDKLYDESMDIIAALGSVSNIQTVSACATRLRVSLKDNNVVNEGVFKKLGAPGVLKVGVGIQAILGGKADIYSQEINDILANPDKTP